MSVIDNKETHRLESLTRNYYNTYISTDITYDNCEIVYTDNIYHDYIHMTDCQRFFLPGTLGTTYYNKQKSTIFISYQDDIFEDEYYKHTCNTTIHEMIHVNDYVVFDNNGIDSGYDSPMRKYIVLWSEFHAYYIELLHSQFLSAYYDQIDPEYYEPQYPDTNDGQLIADILLGDPNDKVSVMVFMASLEISIHHQDKMKCNIERILHKFETPNLVSSLRQLHNLLHGLLQRGEYPGEKELLEVFDLASYCGQNL